ncbi:hypothetical protein SAMN05444156_0446 [Verrucomicrobium sp. GAS474]|uniref:hypothetical protein n=1 Tax=Verrucomicrobium sp. GAS474 TaxID=1882831 RepID=UPI00087C70F1|nr:hypothetical protein [Verrucomicrobium sp. GAS474]SDT88802.1 hypothetical protein SAMN05444156_0446 [Verrucomicrobium sp. GAS474]
MKTIKRMRLPLVLGSLALACFLGSSPAAQAGVHVGVGIGVGPPAYYGPNPYYAQRYWVPGYWEIHRGERVWIPGYWAYSQPPPDPYYYGGPTVIIGGGGHWHGGGYHHGGGHHH